RDLEETGMGIVEVNRLLDRAVRSLGIVPDVIAGHSIGEWSGMVSSGILPEAELDTFVSSLKKGTLSVPGVVFAAAGCSAERAREAMEGLEQIELSHDNCPHQVIFCGIEESVDIVLLRLRDDGVLCEKLPFQSGFHSSLFADYLAPHRKNFDGLALQKSDTTLFSATTCEPYPTTVDEIRQLSLDHLVRPVRFREVIERLHDDGVRVFVQVGTGTLVSFVEDTLRGRPHLAISANAKDRSGIEQLKRLAAALFVEGGEIRWEKLGVSSKRRTERLALGVPLVKSFTPLAIIPEERPTSPELDTSVEEVLRGAPPEVAREFENVLRGVVDAQRSVVEALTRKSSQTLAPRESAFDIPLSVDAFPELLDHCFFRQPEGWMNVTDRHPIVPMTASIDWMIDAAEKLVPERVAVGLENMQALRWIVASVPTHIHVTTSFDGKDRVHVAFEGFCDATIVLAEKYGDPPSLTKSALLNSTRPPIEARALYTDRWMFHGPQYQGVVTLDAIGDDGITGTLEAKKATGALLDNAGQLFGFWVMAKNDVNRMALPVHIDKIEFFGPRPKAGARFFCDARIQKQDERSVIADLTLAQGDRVWAKIEGWEDRRFDTDARLWDVMLHPEDHALAVTTPEGFTIFEDIYRAASTRDQLARRYLGESERAQYESQGPRGQRAWLNGRIAVKDAIRNLLWRRAAAGAAASAKKPIFPVEIEISNDASGEPIASCAFERDVRVSIAHKDDMAIAMATVGKRVGVDIEKIAPRPASFEEISFTIEELRLIDSNAHDEWITRLWSAKEAAAKARGTGLVGNPRRFVIRDRSGERLLVDDILVETRRRGDFIVSWTVS
ncbi:MAG: 4'-phosphopantetheinyl transferase superfamily protein, partial [Polyangiaceae bacterium]